MKKIITIATFLFSSIFFAQDISKITFSGNKKTRTQFLEKIINTKNGKLLDSAQIEANKDRLIRLPGIANVTYAVSKNENDTYEVIYSIDENFTIIPSANVYTTNNEEFAYRIGLYEFNGFGRSIIFGGYFQRDIYNSFGLSFRAPYLFSNKVGISTNFQNLTTQEPVFLENGTAEYKYNNISYEVLGLYEFDLKNRAEVGVNYFTETYNFKNGATAADVPQNLEVNKLLYKFIYEFNSVKAEYYLVDGFKNTFNFQYVTSRDVVLPSFLIGLNDFVYYKRFGNSGNWANRLRLGLATNNDSPFAPFAVDNNLNIRGVGNIIDRGTAAIVLNTEYRQTFFEKGWFVLQGNAFVDAGSWRNPGGDFGDFGESQNIRVYPGIGLRFLHKRIFNAIFRIDYGYGISREATQGFVFGIGQYF